MRRCTRRRNTRSTTRNVLRQCVFQHGEADPDGLPTALCRRRLACRRRPVASITTAHRRHQRHGIVHLVGGPPGVLSERGRSDGRHDQRSCHPSRACPPTRPCFPRALPSSSAAPHRSSRRARLQFLVDRSWRHTRLR